MSAVARDPWILDTFKSTPASDTVNEDVLVNIIKRIIKECLNNSKSSIRQSGVIWLLCVVKYASSSAAISKEMKLIQTAFINMLSDPDEITQDVASRGLGLVYDQVDQKIKDELVSSLFDRLVSGKRTKLTIDDDTELFQPGTMGSAPDG